jgi:hypothetical protein
MEPDMFLHLPIAIMATLSPIPVADTVPTFGIMKECRYEGGSAANVDQCSRDETAALRQLKAEWVQFVDAEKRSCMITTQIGGFASYVELLTCMEMARDAKSADNNNHEPRANPELRRPIAKQERNHGERS